MSIPVFLPEVRTEYPSFLKKSPNHLPIRQG
jgi:hypothetical protein